MKTKRTQDALIVLDDITNTPSRRRSRCESQLECRCRNHISIPTSSKSRVKRYISNKDIWCLPSQLLEHVCSYLHVKDLLSIMQTNSHMYNSLKQSSIAWRHTRFQSIWPSRSNRHFFERAMCYFNFEAAIKLAVTYLYSEGVTNDGGKRLMENSYEASKLLSYADSMLSHTMEPVSWILYRPPWSDEICCKHLVYEHIKRKAFSEDSTCSKTTCLDLISIAKIALLRRDGELARKALEKANQLPHPTSSEYELWSIKYNKTEILSNSSDSFQAVRQLRIIIASSSRQCTQQGELTLLNCYMSGQYGGLDPEIAAEYCRRLVVESEAADYTRAYSSNPNVTPQMRNILLDWIVEVCATKDIPSHTLYQSIYLVDKYISLRKSQIKKHNLQLLGITCLVMASRLHNEDVTSIREACWLTDSTYTYFEVVRMMAEIIIAHRNDVKAVTVLDYLNCMCNLSVKSSVELSLANYICDLTLLHTILATHKMSHIAASCIILAKLMANQDKSGDLTLWDSRETMFTGLLLQDLRSCLLHIHEKVFVEPAPCDHKQTSLTAIFNKYAEEKHYMVSKLPFLKRDTLIKSLGGEIAMDAWVQGSANLRNRDEPYQISTPAVSSLRCETHKIGASAKQKLRSLSRMDSQQRQQRLHDASFSDYSDMELDDSMSSNESDSEYDATAAETSFSGDELDASVAVDSMPDNYSLSIDLKAPLGAISVHKATRKASNSTICHRYSTRAKSAHTSTGISTGTSGAYSGSYVSPGFLPTSNQIKRKTATSYHNVRYCRPKISEPRE